MVRGPQIDSNGHGSDPEVTVASTCHFSPRPWGHPKRAAMWVMTYTTGGHGRYRLGTVQVPVSAGDLVLTESDAPFEYSVPGPEAWDCHTVAFNPWPAWSPPLPFDRLASGLYHTHVQQMQPRQRIEDAFRRLIADVRAHDAAEVLADLWRSEGTDQRGTTDPRRELALMAIREVLLLVSADTVETARLDPRVVGALHVITADLAKHHDMNALAGTAGLSTWRFIRLFREQLGVPPRRAIRTLRLQQAALQLAYGNELVGAIAEELGFSSIYDFSRGFRRTYGVSPSVYRKQFRTMRIPRGGGPAPPIGMR